MTGPLLTFGRRIKESSTDTYDQLAEWIPFVATIVLCLHPLFWFGNEIWEESEPWLGRIIAILAILPYAIPLKYFPSSIATKIKAYTVPALLITGPAFLFCGLILELSSSDPGLDIVMRRQYEFAGSFITVALIATDLLVVVLLNCGLCALVLLTMSIFLEVDFSLFESSWITMTSGYLLLVTTILLVAKQAHQKLAYKREALSSIGSAIAHELRTPLLTIKAHGEYIQRSTTQSNHTEVAKSCQAILNEIDSASTLIDIFLVNSSEGLIAEANDSFDAADSIEEAVTRYPYRNESERRAVTIYSDKSGFIRGPRTLFIHVFYNLLKNALNNPRSEAETRITINIQADELSLVVKFMDNGAGISKHELKHIFDPFYTNSPNPGTGIGLAFVKSTIENQFNGSIRCTSIIGEFTQFVLNVPLDTDVESD